MYIEGVLASRYEFPRWSVGTSTKSGFQIERPPGNLIHATAADVSTYSDIGLSCNTVYHYAVKAVNAAGVSAAAAVSAATLTCPPACGGDAAELNAELTVIPTTACFTGRVQSF